MKPAPFTYRRAASTGEAIALVAGHDGFAKFIAGGQTLGPMINLRLSHPDLVVDISRLPELHGVAEKDGHLLVGAATPHAHFEDGVVPDVANGLLRHGAAGIAYRAIRNRGTLGGSLAHADPSAEWPTIMLALGVRVHARSAQGPRQIAIEDLVQGAMTTALADDELLESVAIPLLSRAARWGLDKRCRKVGEFAHSLACAVADTERGFHRIVLGATGGAPRRLERMGHALAEPGGWRAGRERELRAAYEADIDAAGLAFDEYDRHVHGLAAIRAAQEALSS
jgi:carbon-monoxide dehydrogenase medium subunit